MADMREQRSGDPLISIVIPFYNCRYVDEAIRNAWNQTYSNIEVIVVNDGSDCHVERIVPYLGRIVYVEKVNGGTASALNAGIMAARGDYFAWLSADDLYDPVRLEKQLAFMRARRSAVSFSNFDYIDAGGQVMARNVGMRFDRTIDFYRHLTTGCPVNGCTVLMQTDIFDRVGLFDERLRYTKDYDMWMRIVLAGYDFPYMDESLVMYRIHEEMTTKTQAAAIPAELESTRLKYRDRLLDYVESLNGRKPK